MNGLFCFLFSILCFCSLFSVFLRFGFCFLLVWYGYGYGECFVDDHFFFAEGRDEIRVRDRGAGRASK